MSKCVKTRDEFCSQLLVLREPRKCAGCGCTTLTATPRQPKLGRCLACIKLTVTADLADELAVTAEDLIIDELGVDLIEPDWQPQRLKPDTYQRHEPRVVVLRWLTSGRYSSHEVDVGRTDAGPCVLCRRVIRRYGSFGTTLCADCSVVTA